LDKLHGRSDRIYYPAHGPAVTNPRQLVRGMIGHRRQRERQIIRLLTEGGAAEVAGLVPQMYKGLPEVLLPAAGQSVLAHLIEMEQRGVVMRSGSHWSISE